MRDLPTAVALAALGALWPSAAARAQTACADNPMPAQWFVQAGAGDAAARGTRERPFTSLADIERCAPEGATITVLARDGTAVLDGGIRLKRGQKLMGEPSGAPASGQGAPRLTSTGGAGDAITLAGGNEVRGLHIDNPMGAAIVGDNVAGAHLRDLLITRRGTAPPPRLDPALCRVVRDGDAVDNAQSVLRGCTGRQAPAVKPAILLLLDNGVGAGPVDYLVERVRVEDNPSHEAPTRLWPAGIWIASGARARAALDVRDSSIENTGRGIVARAYDRAALTVTVTDTRLDSLRSDGIGITTGFLCSGRDKTAQIAGVDCAPLAPAPVSDARLVLHVDGLRFSDRAGHGQPNDAAAIEPVAFDRGRSTIEVHVQRSDIVGAAAPGVFTFYAFGWPEKDVMDFGCVNPAPGDAAARGADRAACEARGYTSVGQNRIFGNTRNSKSYSRYSEVALEGPGAMIAQGNYWGDLVPADGVGDALGECVVFNWSGEVSHDPPPVKPVPDARCELYRIAGMPAPTGIDGRFHLARDPRPPR